MLIQMDATVGWLTALFVLGACGDKGGDGPSSGDTGPTGGGIETGVAEDVDDDGFSEDDGDCDDDDPGVSPDAIEVCDGIDQDCDGVTDEGTSCYDDDDDGFSEDDGDCDDDDAAVHPGAEDCGVVDANCDGVIDDAGTWVPRDYEMIQDAIDAAADGASICVESGTYAETLDTLGKPLWIVGVNGADSTVVDGAGAYPVLSIVDGEGRDTVVEGFTITGGEAQTEGDYTSGGVLVHGASPTLRGLVVTGNQASDWPTEYYGSAAGGMVLVDSNARVDDVEISDNTSATWSYGFAHGGGLYVLRGAAEFTSLRIHGNLAGASGGYAYGGGAELSGWTGTFRDAEIYDNVADGYFSAEGGGLRLDYGSGTLSGITIHDNAVEVSAGTGYGGGVAILDGTDHLSDLDVHDNAVTGGASGAGGGGLYASGGAPSVEGALVWRNSVLATRRSCGGGLAADAIEVSNALVFVNEAALGGGICAFGEGMSLVNVTVYANEADYGDAVGGGLWIFSFAPSLLNVDLSENQADEGSAVYDESGTLTASSFSYCNVYDDDVVVAGTPLTVAGSGGNLSVDPLYADVSSGDAADWDLSLVAGSPLIDAGDPSISDVDGTRSDIGGYGGSGGSWP